VEIHSPQMELRLPTCTLKATSGAIGGMKVGWRRRLASGILISRSVAIMLDHAAPHRVSTDWTALGSPVWAIGMHTVRRHYHCISSIDSRRRGVLGLGLGSGSGGLQIWSLSWGVPGWVGNHSYFSDDNIEYQIAWLKCLRDSWGVEPDLLGLWNGVSCAPQYACVCMNLAASLSPALIGGNCTARSQCSGQGTPIPFAVCEYRGVRKVCM
jgi:hypothetical protein